MNIDRMEALAANYRPASRVRFNAESFGFIVGFPDSEIVLARPSAMTVLHAGVSREALAPHFLADLEVWPGFHLNTPPLLWLEITRRCNLSCPHCYIDAGHARQGELPTERWHELIDEFAAMGVWAVAFTGGEPTLHRDFVELVNHARAKDLIVGIATHGMFLDDAMLDQLPKKGVIISVSIDDLHLGKSKNNMTAHQGKQAVVRAQDHGFLVNIMTNTNRLNMSGLHGLVSWAEAKGVSIRSVPMSPIGRGKRHLDLLSQPEDTAESAKFWLRECELEHAYHKAAGVCVGSIFNYGLSFAYMTRRCSSGRYLGYIASDGTVYPCTMCAGEDLFSSGSVREQGFAEVWRSHWAIRDLSWDNFDEACRGCPINSDRYYCAARCPALSHARNGTLTDCGASPFEINSTLIRTAMLEDTATGRASNQPLVPLTSERSS